MIENLRTLLFTLFGAVVGGIVVTMLTIYIQKPEEAEISASFRHAEIPHFGSVYSPKSEEALIQFVKNIFGNEANKINISKIWNYYYNYRIINVNIRNSSNIKSKEIELRNRNSQIIAYRYNEGSNEKYSLIDTAGGEKIVKLQGISPGRSIEIFLIAESGPYSIGDPAREAITLLYKEKEVPIITNAFDDLPSEKRIPREIIEYPQATAMLAFTGVVLILLLIIGAIASVVTLEGTKRGFIRYSSIYKDKDIERFQKIIDGVTREKAKEQG